MIIFARHGETEANRQRLALGRADPLLTERGAQQAEALAAKLGNSGIETVFTSPLLRARATAEPIAAAAGVELVVDDRLLELDYGEWDEMSFADLPPAALAQWRNDPTFAPPGGESLRDVTTRVAGFCLDVLDGPNVVAVSHVSPIKCAVTWALDASEELGWRMFLDLASITRIAGRNGQASLVGFNDTNHLPPRER
ncbi:MAG: histidine phosphatase family protein [Acidimicrobiia bacterium]